METIYTLPDLIELIEERKMSSKQICDVLERGFNVFAEENRTPQDLIQALKDYWSKYGNEIDKPLLIDESTDIEKFLKDNVIENRLWRKYKTAKAARLASVYYKNRIAVSNEDNIYYQSGKPSHITIPQH